MGDQAPSGHDATADCDGCERDTRHSVTVELRLEPTDGDDPGVTRHPYRVATCRVCSARVVERVGGDRDGE